MSRNVIVLLFLILASCQNAPKENEPNWKEVVETLASDDDKKIFLENIYEKVASSRTHSNNAISIYGLNSPEHLKLKESFRLARNESLEKIEAYLNTYGYPSVMKLGGVAAYAPFFVIQNMEDVKSRERNFTFLYDAYTFGDITSDAFYMYLADLYYYEFKTDYLYDPNLNKKAQIKKLMKALQFD